MSIKLKKKIAMKLIGDGPHPVLHFYAINACFPIFHMIRINSFGSFNNKKVDGALFS